MTWLPYAAAAFAIVLGTVTFMHNKDRDTSKTGQQLGVMLSEIGGIKSGIDDIKRKQERTDNQSIDIITRLVQVESAVKQAHKRLDQLYEEKREGV